MENIFKLALRKTYNDGFSIVWNSEFDTIDKYLMIIVLNYFYLTDYWSIIKDACYVNYPNETIEYDYQFACLIVSYIKGLTKENFDCVVYEGVRPLCLNNKVNIMRKLISLSKELNKPIKFAMYRNDILNKCNEYNMLDMKKLIDTSTNRD